MAVAYRGHPHQLMEKMRSKNVVYHQQDYLKSPFPGLSIFLHGDRCGSPQLPILVRWQRPLRKVVVINCDGSYKSSSGMCKYGAILRDPFGRFIAAKTGCIQKPDFMGGEGTKSKKYRNTVLMTELLAIRAGLQLANMYGAKHVEIQSDSKDAVSLLHGLMIRCPKKCVCVLDDIERELCSFKSIGMIHVYREGNRAADFLSKMPETDGEELYPNVYELPLGFQQIIKEDLFGVLVTRMPKR